MPDAHGVPRGREGRALEEDVVEAAQVGADEESQAGYTLVSGGPVIVADLRTEARFSGPDLALEVENNGYADILSEVG